jgi:glycosyltransferase involved in cell wall biosynthesis
MVVAEALARGLPLISTTGGALADTAPADCCLRCAPGDVEGFRSALQRWFDDGALRHRLVRAAVGRRNGLRDWPAAGSAFSAALREVPA